MQTEREQFRDFRDLNKDGKLDGSEVGHWVLPPAQDQPLVEANHLLHESDTDKVRGRGGWRVGGLRCGMRRDDQDAGLGLWGSCLENGKGTESLRWGGRRGGPGTQRAMEIGRSSLVQGGASQMGSIASPLTSDPLRTGV